MPKPDRLVPGTYYHIYNRGNNGENIFIAERNYRFFLDRYARYIEPVAATYAYCLLRNHFHLLIRTYTEEEQRFRTFKTSGVLETPEVCDEPEVSNVPFVYKDPSRQFSHLFNSYAKAINRAQQRTGSLFEGRFKRIPVTSEDYLIHLVVYIHRNPEKHGFVDDFRDWPYSSYHALRTDGPTRLQRDEAIAWFGNIACFDDTHGTADEKTINHLIRDDHV